MAYAPTLAWTPLSGLEEAQIVAAHAARMQRYVDFLSIPSVSAIPEHAVDCRKAVNIIVCLEAGAALARNTTTISPQGRGVAPDLASLILSSLGS